MQKIDDVKETCGRGKKRGGICDAYYNFGYRFAYTPDGKVGEYKYADLPHVGKEEREALIKEVRDSIGSFVDDLERFAKPLFLQLSGEILSQIHKVRTVINLPSVGKEKEIGIATQFSIGLNYWSPIHTDDDFFYTILSCLCSSDEDEDKILYYFYFPDYGIKVPLRSGDIIVFNPLIRHCCSDPCLPGAYIFSAYVSEKTVNYQAKDVLNAK